MKKFLIIVLAISLSSCIPVKVAPKFKKKGYKVMVAKKFQRKMPKETSFIFKDSKNANEFYQYINKKYKQNDQNVGFKVPFQLEGETLYLTYHEAERENKTLNIGIIATDLAIEKSTGTSLLQDAYTSRKGHWYILITVHDNELKNCLKDNHALKAKTLQYLKDLKKEYLTTHNYEELLFAKKS
jgi:hypothetical protein